MKHKLLSFILLLSALIAGTGSVWAAKTYRLTQVTSVSAGNLYVFERNSRVLGSTVSKSALQTVETYSTTGLTGSEAYVWNLESAKGGYHMRNNSLTSNTYFNNGSSTTVSFGSNGSSIWVFNFSDNKATIQNTSNDNRFLGDNGSNAYKAYATGNLSTYGHDFTVYLLEEEVAVTSLSVKTAPTKVRYEVGEALDMTGFVLDADGADVTSGYTMKIGETSILDGATLSSAGKKTITVTYRGKTVDQTISVGSATSIAVTTAPTKTSYDTGDSFDPTEMVVTATLSTGEDLDPDTWTKEVTGYTIDPADGLQPSDTYVTITYAGQTATQNITVTDVAVKGVALNKTSTTIATGGTETLTLIFTPANATNKAVTWSSSNEGVATVENGVVRAVKSGTATITVTTTDGNHQATCTVTVNAAKGSVENPYTVAEVSKGNANGKNGIYVIGYIVGSWKDNTFKPNDLVNTNLALADAYDSDTTIPVELPSGDVRDAWGPASHSENIGVAKVILKGNGQKYFNKNAIKGTFEITKVAEAVKVTSAGYATYVSANALDFTGKGIKAYIAKADGTTGVMFTQVEKVPANTGVLLYKDGGTTEEIPVLTGAAENVTGNVFKRGTGAAVASVEGDLHNYILNNVGGVVGFYKAYNQMVATNRAYIQIDENSTPVKGFIALPGSDEATGINAIDNGQLTMDNAIYDLSGRRVAKPTRGLYIVNGKKVLVK